MHKIFIINKINKLKDTYLNFKENSIKIVKMKQTHSNNIVKIEKPSEKHIVSIKNADAIYTTQSNILLGVKFADCMPLVIYHPKKIICVIHAGRKGTQKNIVKKALQILVSEIKTKKNFQIYIGPHLCEMCHEIDKEKKQHFNLLEENLIQIKSILELKNIKLEINSECTKCGPNFFSYRGDNKTQKRNYLFCMLN